ncbi:MAG: hypothetical protein ACEPOW_05645 [Bacteroidales bacterium]
MFLQYISLHLSLHLESRDEFNIKSDPSHPFHEMMTSSNRAISNHSVGSWVMADASGVALVLMI